MASPHSYLPQEENWQESLLLPLLPNYLEHITHLKHQYPSYVIIKAWSINVTLPINPFWWKLEKINLDTLSHHILQKKPFQHASHIKLIRDWIPTYSSLCWQGREYTSICPRCNLAVEIPTHVYQCPDPTVVTNRMKLLTLFLSQLVNIHTPIHIIISLEYKLSLTLDIPYSRIYSAPTELPPSTKNLLIPVIRQQTVVGWHLFLKGYHAFYWLTTFQHLSTDNDNLCKAPGMYN